MEAVDVQVLKFLASEVVFGGVFLKGAVLAGSVILLGLALRRASAATRSAVWTTAFGMLLVLPLLLPVLAGRISPLLELGVAPFPDQLFEPARAARPASGGGIPAALWLAGAWAAGALVLMGRFGLHLARIRRVTEAAVPADGALVAVATRSAAELGVRRRVRIALSDVPGVPLTWGAFRPTILLPPEAREWPRERQRAVVHHEMAHVARRDYLALVAMELARALHWPNPLVWYLVGWARADQERACDDAAIRSGIDAPEYARHLVAVARSFSLGSAQPVGTLPIVRGSTLGKRVRAVMRDGASRRPATLGTALASLLVVGTLASAVAGSSLWACPERGDDGPEARVVGTRVAGPLPVSAGPSGATARPGSADAAEAALPIDPGLALGRAVVGAGHAAVPGAGSECPES